MPDGMGGIPPVVSPTLGGSKFEYTSGGSCGCACQYRPLIGTFTCGAIKTSTSGGKILWMYSPIPRTRKGARYNGDSKGMGASRRLYQFREV